MRKAKRVNRGTAAHLARPDVMKNSKVYPKKSSSKELRELKDRKETKASASPTKKISKVNLACRDLRANLGKTEILDQRERKGFMEFLDILVHLVKKENGGHLEKETAPQGPLVPKVSLERKVTLDPRESPVLQEPFWKALEEKLVQRETWVRKETEA